MVFHTLFHYHDTELRYAKKELYIAQNSPVISERGLLTLARLRYEKMSIDYCHKDRKHDKFPLDFEMALHFVRPEDLGGFSLTLNHQGSLLRSKFPSLDPEIVYGGLRIFIRSAKNLSTEFCEGVFVRFEIEGLEIDSETTTKDEGKAEWDSILDVVVSSKNILCKVVVLDKRGMVKVAIAEGNFSIARCVREDKKKDEIIHAIVTCNTTSS